MKKIALLISQYNSGEWIEEKIVNILESSIAQDIEIVCVNANSPDPLDDSVPRKFKQIKYIKCSERISIYAAWNLAIKESTAPYIANANTDDLVAPHCYNVLSATLDNHQKTGVIYCSWYTIGEKIMRWNQIPTTQAVGGHPGTYAGDFNTAQVGHFPMWRRKIHDEIGPFNDNLPSLGDAEFWARTYFNTQWNFEWLRAPLGAYRWRDGENAWNKYITDDQWITLNSLINIYKNT